MFTGIIEAVGRIGSRDETDTECRLEIECGNLDMADVRIGDSIAVNGCCLTVVKVSKAGFSADVSRETLRCTTLGNMQSGTPVNLEKAMLAGGRFGGHIVSGHVDGVGELLTVSAEGDSLKLSVQVPGKLARYIAAKGSICIDGTSLTVNEVDGERFIVNVIPHTRTATVTGSYQPGQAVNLEVDVVARYLERLMNHEAGTEAGTEAENSSLSRAFLEQHGFSSSKG